MLWIEAQTLERGEDESKKGSEVDVVATARARATGEHCVYSLLVGVLDGHTLGSALVHDVPEDDAGAQNGNQRDNDDDGQYPV